LNFLSINQSILVLKNGRRLGEGEYRHGARERAAEEGWRERRRLMEANFFQRLFLRDKVLAKHWIGGWGGGGMGAVELDALWAGGK
jgi:hypothetical protein